MNQHEAEPQIADVRPFLPRPGEPAEAYAARLRALHRDLTLVLDAVERGLAASPPPGVEEPEPALEPGLEPALAGDVGVPVVPPPLPTEAPMRRDAPFGGLPRVEVMPPTRERDDEEDWARTGRRAGEAEAEVAFGAAPPTSASPAPAPDPVAPPEERRAGVVIDMDLLDDAPLDDEDLDDDEAGAPAEPPVTPTLTAPPPVVGWTRPPAPQRNATPVLIAAVVAGWLAAIALLLVLLLGL